MQEATRLGLEMVAEYSEVGCSGSSPNNRPRLGMLLADAEEGLFKHVFVRDFARFSRSQHAVLAVIKDLRRFGVTLHFVENEVTM